MALPCGVCHDSESKYKCPTCELRYCSIKCFKTHKETHSAASNASATAEAAPPNSSPPTPPPPSSTPSTKPPPNPKPSFTPLLEDPTFQRLLTRYPQLRPQLQLIYALTLEPSAEDTRGWNRVAKWGTEQEERGDASSRRKSRHQHRYRGVRGRGVGGRRFISGADSRGQRFHDFREESSDLRGTWTREKGEKLGLTVLRMMREGENDVELREGMKEFLQLCQMRFGGGGHE